MMQKSCFSLLISDLHLCQLRPNISTQFIEFLQNKAIHAENLFILGDLFEYWAGDDDGDDSHHAEIIHALNTLSNTGTRVYFMHGNRDFLVGDDFAKAAGLTLLKDPTLVNLYGKRVLLSHGDGLCTDDIAYQAFRLQVRDINWQKEFTSQPLAARKAYIQHLRVKSEQEKSTKSMEIMDVNADAVAAMLRQFDYPELLIHGHTHRPKQHLLSVDGHACTRWVLGDWYEQGSCLKLDAGGCSQDSITTEFVSVISRIG